MTKHVIPPSERQREQIMRQFRDSFLESIAHDQAWEACKHRWMKHYPDLVLKLETVGVTFTSTV